jgi:hypothetical protein
MKLYTLHISHRHGDDISIHASHAEATAALAGYSRDWWTKEGLDGEPPENDQEAIRQYWDHIEDESANIEEHGMALPGDERAKPHEIDAARATYANDDIEIEDEAAVARAVAGYWVSAWVWIANDGEG